MRVETTSRTLYKFEELSETAQGRALEALGSRLYEWLEPDEIGDAITEALKFALDGIGGGCEPAAPDLEITGWDVDRGQVLQLKGTLSREDAPAFAWPEGVTAATFGHSDYRDKYVLSVDGEDEDGYELDATDDQDAAFEQAWIEVKGDALKAGRDAIEFAGSEENAREFIENNEVEFTEDGEPA